MSKKEARLFAAVSLIWLGGIGIGLYLFHQYYPKLFELFLPGIGFYVAGAGIAPLGLYLALRRTQTSGEQSENDKRRRIGEEFTRSIELLGGRSAAVRQGGIYALEALAEESEEKRRSTIVKIVASYIRETSRAKPISKGGSVVTTKQTDIEGWAMIAPDGVDIAAALSVIQNLSKKTAGFYLSSTSARAAYDEGMSLSSVLAALPLVGQKIDLSNAYLRNGDLSYAHLHRVNMSDILAEDCVFVKTSFRPAGDEVANMVFSKFEYCDFSGADFSYADLSKATFSGECNFQDAELGKAKLYDTDLSGASNLTQKQIDSAMGDDSTILPSGVSRPRHWGRSSASHK